jgi:hypothetical protein
MGAGRRFNNPLERLNNEANGRIDVVGSLPNEVALIRLAGAVLPEQHEEQQVGKRHLSAVSLTKLKRKEGALEQPKLGANSTTERSGTARGHSHLDEAHTLLRSQSRAHERYADVRLDALQNSGANAVRMYRRG